MSIDSDAYTLKKSFDNFRSRTSKQRLAKEASILTSKMNKTKEDWRTDGRSFIRRRTKKQDTVQPPALLPFNQSSSSKVSASASAAAADIESGVEITEEMTLLNTSNDLKLPVTNEMGNSQIIYNQVVNNSDFVNNVPTSGTVTAATTNSTTTTHSTILNETKRSYVLQILITMYLQRSYTFCGLCILSCYLFTVPQFIQGVLACLCTICILSSFYDFLCQYFNRKINETLNNSSSNSNSTTVGGPERGPFEIPDYSRMSLCEIPSIEEHKQLKSYSVRSFAQF